MTDQGSSCLRLGEMHEPDQEAYRAVSGLAVAALAIGVFSAVVLVDPVAALVPAVGVGVGWRGAVADCAAESRAGRAEGGDRRHLPLAAVWDDLGGALAGVPLAVGAGRQRVGMAWFELVAGGSRNWPIN